MSRATRDHKSTRHRSRATILYLALLFIAIVNLLALTYVKAIPTEANSFLRSQRTYLAHYSCEAGINDSLAFITYELKESREPTPDGPVTRTGEHDDWTWRATITPDLGVVTEKADPFRYYEILSESFAPDSNTVAWRIRITVGEESFSRYTNFTDRFDATYFNLLGTKRFKEGHIHTNSYFKMLPSDNRYDNGTEPAFMGYVTSAGTAPSLWGYDGVDYKEQSQAPYDGANNPIGDRYEKLYSGGRAGLNTSVTPIDMPDSSSQPARQSWGSSSPRPTDMGVYAPLDGGTFRGGYYVVGDIERLHLSVDNGTARLLITQEHPDGVQRNTIIVEGHHGGAQLGDTFVPSGSTGILPDGGDVVLVPGLANGLLYSTGSIRSLEGTNLSPRTIAVDQETGQSITITSSLLRNDTKPGHRPDGPDDILGLLAYNIILSKDIPRNTSNPTYLYVTYLAGRKEAYPRGGFQVEGLNDSTLGKGTFIVYGSLAEGTSYPTVNLAGDIGYGYQHLFDPHAVSDPPPFYPRTGRLPIRSWREESGTW